MATTAEPDEITLTSLCDEVLARLPHGTKDEWASELLDLARRHRLDHELDTVLTHALSRRVSAHAARRAEAHRRAVEASRVIELGVTHDGAPLAGSHTPPRLLTRTLSVRTDDHRSQLTLWDAATPQQFVDAVHREARIIVGRTEQNAVRLGLARAIERDESLKALATVRDVCQALGIDPDTLGLDDLGATA
jgi:hypothetical protein